MHSWKYPVVILYIRWTTPISSNGRDCPASLVRPILRRGRQLRHPDRLYGHRVHTCHLQRHALARQCARLRSLAGAGLLPPQRLPFTQQSGCATDAHAAVFCLANSRPELWRSAFASCRVTRPGPMRRVNVPESLAPRRSPEARETPDQESPPQVYPSTNSGKQGGGMRSHLRTILAAVCAVSLLPAMASAGRGHDQRASPERGRESAA